MGLCYSVIANRPTDQWPGQSAMESATSLVQSGRHCFPVSPPQMIPHLSPCCRLFFYIQGWNEWVICRVSNPGNQSVELKYHHWIHLRRCVSHNHEIVITVSLGRYFCEDSSPGNFVSYLNISNNVFAVTQRRSCAKLHEVEISDVAIRRSIGI